MIEILVLHEDILKVLDKNKVRWVDMQTSVLERNCMATIVTEQVNRLLESALEYASNYMPVFPVHTPTDAGICSCNKPDCSSIGKHPRTCKGLNDATTNMEQIKAWWEKWPDANIGLVTGVESGLMVLDVDDGGEEELRNHPSLPDTVESVTGSGGRHIFFANPEGNTIKNKVRFYDGLDIRAEGGYIVAPPSLHASGKKYEWKDGNIPVRGKLTECPEWLIKAVDSKNKRLIAINDDLLKKNYETLAEGMKEVEPKIKTELVKQVEYVVSQIEEKEIILGNDRYGDWLRYGFALADGLGERGREYFHRVSSQSDRYERGECDKQYDACLSGDPPEDKITIGTFFKYAKEARLTTNKLEEIEEVTASKLMEMEFPETKWMVPSIIPEGLSLLCGKPKSGKSILSLNLAVAVATGGMAFNKVSVEQSGVLYLALEDTHRRLQERLKAVLQNSEPPESLILSTEFKSILDGGIKQLGTWLEQHKDVGFVIIDTYARIKGRKSNSTDIFLDDYNELVEIKDVADSHKIGILLVHHTRKEPSDDVFDTVLGSTGIAAAVDTIIMLTNINYKGTLHVRGRDVEETALALELDSNTLSWVLVGDAGEYSLSTERREIVTLLREKGLPMKLKDIADALGKMKSNIGHMISGLVEEGFLVKARYGEYAIKV